MAHINVVREQRAVRTDIRKSTIPSALAITEIRHVYNTNLHRNSFGIC